MLSLLMSMESVATLFLQQKQHKMKLFNHGKNDMKKLAESFSKILNFEIKDLYRTISAIKDRKKDNSIFIKQMMDTFQQIINESSR